MVISLICFPGSNQVFIQINHNLDQVQDRNRRFFLFIVSLSFFSRVTSVPTGSYKTYET